MKQNIEKMLINELSSLPDAAPYVVRAPLPQAKAEPQKERISLWQLLKQRSLRAYALAAIVLVSVLLPVLYAFGIFTQRPGEGAVVLSINPSVAFVTDKRDIVTGVASRNRDADVLLQDSSFVSSVVGMHVTYACVAFADRARQLGYLSDETGAVKVSVTNRAKTHRKDMQNALYQSLSSYFCDSGVFVAVVTEGVKPKAFAEANGFSGKNAKELSQSIVHADTLVTQTEVAGMPEEEMEQNYAQLLADYAEDAINESYHIAAYKKQAIAALYSKNNEIEEHEDNPGFLLKDYWSVAGGMASFTQEFTLLMGEMAAMLNAYYTQTGDSIDGKLALGMLYQYYQSVDLAERRASCDSVIESLHSASNSFTVALVLALFGDDSALTDWLDGLLGDVTETPASKEEYEQKAELMLERERELMLQHNKAEYSAKRDPIPKEDYASYERELINEYGSLEAYYNSRAEKK